MTQKIGILVGEHALSLGFGANWTEVWENCFKLAMEEYEERGAVTEPLEVVKRSVEGLPTGSQHEVVEAWRELEAEGCLAILGPSNADNGMAVQATANAGEVVTIVFGCSQRLPSPWTFSMPWGQAPVDAMLGVEWLASQGLRRAGLLWDTAWHGEEWRHFIEIAAARFGVELIGHCRIPALVIDDEARERQYEMAREGVAKLRELKPNAIIMATSHGSLPFVTALSQSGWDIPKMKVGAGLGGGPLWEGWVGTTILDDNNERAQRFLRRYDERFGPPEHEDMLISVHDGSRALLEAITLAPIMTREGVRTGMEQVTMLPATAGASSTVITFGPYDHRGYKGRDVSVLRRSLGDGPMSRWPMEPYYSGEVRK